MPIHAEAHQLPFAPEHFDVIVSVDAYQYFGTADLYLGYLLGFLRRGGRLGIVTPALFTEFGAERPAGAPAVLGLGVLLLPRPRVVAHALGEDGQGRRRRTPTRSRTAGRTGSGSTR